MEPIKTVEDFKNFIKTNQDLILANTMKASELTLDDEWMQEDEWEEVYQREVMNDGKI